MLKAAKPDITTLQCARHTGEAKAVRATDTGKYPAIQQFSFISSLRLYNSCGVPPIALINIYSNNLFRSAVNVCMRDFVCNEHTQYTERASCGTLC